MSKYTNRIVSTLGGAPLSAFDIANIINDEEARGPPADGVYTGMVSVDNLRYRLRIR